MANILSSPLGDNFNRIVNQREKQFMKRLGLMLKELKSKLKQLAMPLQFLDCCGIWCKLIQINASNCEANKI